nr:oligosaccharide flippase family protein [Bradyrhizobium sp. CCBAU 11434]
MSEKLDSLRNRAIRAGVWTLAGYTLSYILRLASNLLLSRLLIPDAFGVIAIANLVLVGLAMLSDLGLKPSVVQNRRGHEGVFLNTAWLVQIVRGLLLCALAVFISLIIGISRALDLAPHGSVYADPSLPYVIAVLSLTTAIAGFESTRLLEASRNLQLARITRLDLASQIFGFVLMIGWASVDHSIWALVAGALATSLSRMTLSHVWLPGLANRVQWDRSAFVEIVRFGKWLFLSSVLYFIATSGDRVVLGALVDSRTLGAYAIAFLIYSSIDQVLTKIIVDVSFPALTEIVRSRRHQVQEAYYRFHFAIASVAYFCAGVLAISGGAIISVLYDQRYQQAGWILQVLALGLLTVPYRIATQAFLAFNLGKSYFYLQSVRVVTLFVALPVGFAVGGFAGAVWGVVASYFSSIPLVLIYARSVGLFRLRSELRPIPVMLVGLLAGGMVRFAATRILH